MDTEVFKNDQIIISALKENDNPQNDLGFERLGNSEVASHISGLLQFVPEIAEATALNGAWQIVLPEGVSGYLTWAKDGSGLLSEIHDWSSGDYIGKARWTPMDFSANLAYTMSGLSIITSQYYLNQINNKLVDIQGKLDRVLDFLYSDKICEIHAEFQNILGIYSNYQSIMGNDTQRVASLCSIQHAKVIAEKNILFYHRDMQRISDMDGSKAVNKQKQVANDISNDLKGYSQSLALFGLCCMLEPVISQNFNDSYMKYIQSLVDKQGMLHDISVSKIQGKLLGIIENVENSKFGKISEELLSTVRDLETMVGESSPLEEFEKTIEQIHMSLSTKSEYKVLKDGTVYKRKVS